MIMFTAAITLALASISSATSQVWELNEFTSLVSFGDSYTDDSRLKYFVDNNGSAPPIGWVNPAVSKYQLSMLSRWILIKRPEQCFG